MNLKSTKLFLITALTFLFAYSTIEVEPVNVNRTKVSEAYEALNFFSTARSYPNDLIPDEAYYKAFKKIEKDKLYKSQSNSLTEPWSTIGPHNTAGRILAIAFNPQNPNTMFAGSASGGLWVSYSGGVGVNAWHRIDTEFPILAVSTIAVDQTDSNVIYIGTGEIYNYYAASTGAAYRNTRGTYGIGILKSTDSGISWNKSLDWSYNEQKGIWAIKINPLNYNTVWAATTEGTYRSYDAGTTWQLVHNVVMVNDLVINPVDTSIVITGNGNFASTEFGIYRTSDGGNSWTHITSGLPPTFAGKILLDIYNADPDIVYASIGNGFEVGINNASWLCKSTDSGITWTIMTTQDYSQWQGWFSHDVAINQSNPDELIVIGIAVWKSTNGGATITQISDGGQSFGQPPIGGPEGGTGYTHADAHDVKQHPTNHSTYYIATDGGIFRTTDFGTTFKSCNGRLQTHQFYNGTSSSQHDSLFMMGGLQDNSTVIYTGNLAWSKYIGGDGSWTAIDASNDNFIFGSWQGLNMMKSTNRGNNWFQVTPPFGGNVAFIAPYKTSWVNGNIIYGGKDKIYKSNNGGSVWTATNNGNLLDGGLPALAMEISYQRSEKVYVATAPYSTLRGHIFRTTNGGDSWVNITQSLPDRFFSDIAVDPNNDSEVYVTLYGFGSGHVFKSTNSGDSWDDISGDLPDVPTVSVIVDPNYSEHVYVGNDLGVYVSTNGGGTWDNFSEGLPTAVIAMDLNITLADNVIRVATHGNGAYERKLLSTLINGTEPNPIVAKMFKLAQNYPNPFNPSTTISWEIPADGFVSLKVYDLLGNLVATLINENKPAGPYGTKFNASQLASGIYFYKLETRDFSQTKKMILLK